MTTHHGGESGRIHTVQAERDLEANWEVDLARKLEQYLLKICSGEVSSADEVEGCSTVNFAEAALLLQGSVQVYSRKVEYLYNLVLHALQFLSEKRQQDQPDGTVQPEENASRADVQEENDLFWGLDDIPVEAKNCLDSPSNKDTPLNYFVKPHANLVVLEGDCLDSIGDGNELESYLLTTNDLYRDFILLDPRDAIVVDDYLNGGETSKGQYSSYKGSSTRKSFQSPTRHSVGSAYKSSLRKKQDADVSQSPRTSCGFEANDCNPGPNPPCHFDTNDGFDMDDRYLEPGHCDDSDDDSSDNDPWKPLNPHEPGNLKVKLFKKVKAFKKNAATLATRVSIATLFPLAQSSGPISPELRDIWERRQKASVKQGEPQFAPPYEKLRTSLDDQGNDACNTCSGPEDHDENDGYDGGFPDFDTPGSMDDVPINEEQHEKDAARYGTNDAFDDGLPNSQASLEDLCRSHLDALLASIAETEKQTELAARVSSWKQKIEHNLEEQDSHPPFDIHEYGARILDRLSLGNEDVTPFTDVVKGQEKHDVARTFSALLQLVNNGDVVLDRNKHQKESTCYTAVNPFHLRLGKARVKAKVQVSKKRGKSPLKSESTEHKIEKCGQESNGSRKSSSKSSSKLPAKVGTGKIGGVRCTPESKRRRRSRHAEGVDIHLAG